MEIKKKIQQNISLASFTSIRLGGPAKLFVECESEEEILAALTYARNLNIPVHVLGGGSNTLFADKGFDGLVIKISNKGIEFKEEDGETYVSASAGEAWDVLVEKCVNEGLAGFECLSGIPGSVGAAPVQNIGAYGQDVAMLVEEIRVINRDALEEQTFSRNECHFSYRGSRFKGVDANRYIITSVVFKAVKCERPSVLYPDIIKELGGKESVALLDCGADSLKKIRDVVLRVRAKKGMVTDKTSVNSRSCGSFFINPVVSEVKLKELQSQENEDIPFFQKDDEIKIPAAWLVGEAGFLKGFRHGGVGISEHHNLAIVNYDGTANEVIVLTQNIQKAVKEKFGIELVTEPNLIPFRW